MWQKILAFAKSTFSEADGTASASRVLAGTSVVAVIGWVTYIVIRTGSLPELGGASMFLTASFSGYGVNKVTRAFGNPGAGDVKGA